MFVEICVPSVSIRLLSGGVWAFRCYLTYEAAVAGRSAIGDRKTCSIGVRICM